jgi:L-cystine uptake protein TcyP (sodium:dicarboxylate symporter family)
MHILFFTSLARPLNIKTWQQNIMCFGRNIIEIARSFGANIHINKCYAILLNVVRKKI